MCVFRYARRRLVARVAVPFHAHLAGAKANEEAVETGLLP